MRVDERRVPIIQLTVHVPIDPYPATSFLPSRQWDHQGNGAPVKPPKHKQIYLQPFCFTLKL